MRLEDLDERQRGVVDVVASSDDRVLVLGGAGTGKTTTALWTARTYLETSSETPLPRALFLTFSRAAVSQIVSRSPGVLSGSNSRIEILTFHGLSYWLLRAFGRYAGYGSAPIAVQSGARTKLLGRDGTRLLYDDLIPGATSLLKRSDRLRRLISSRWGLVVCDEAQDTSADQWELIRLIGTRKLVLLGDFNQMIYSSFVPGVSTQQFRRVREWVDREVELLPRSHRDPSGVIPAVAEAVRVRNFEHEAIVEAIRTERLYIHFDVDEDDYQDILASEINKSRALGLRDVGVFAHSNVSVSEVAELLNNAGIDHALIGIPEAHSEALGCMAVQCAYAAGLAGDSDIREALALFLTASVRGRDAPPVALALIGAGALRSEVDAAIDKLEQALTSATYGTMGDLGQIAMRSWFGLSLAAGFRPWQRAAQHFGRLLSPVRDEPVNEDAVRRLQSIVSRSQNEALIDLDHSERSRVKLMTYHQTKSREADTAIHVYRREDFFGREGEPFEEASRLLNVAITRARKRLVLILPRDPHPLVEPFNALRRVQASTLRSV
ncbi:MAG: UvrD-helicase domain-containing protein [Chloroflexota bacterium]|nr:UvrD-helicase domain-containing protein [Chloroflexota bacterium]MDE2884823.1 UvrD-helicase domain-containing protein [Chloroflexota bacterium]